jgi:hypothetical protein
MQHDPVREAYTWCEKYFREHGTPLPLLKDFKSAAAYAADARAREGASDIEWTLFTTTFFEVALRLYQEYVAKVREQALEVRHAHYQTLFNEAAELDREFHTALKTLINLATDFSDSGKLRWLVAMRAVNQLREQRLRIAQAIQMFEREDEAHARDEL